MLKLSQNLCEDFTHTVRWEQKTHPAINLANDTFPVSEVYSPVEKMAGELADVRQDVAGRVLYDSVTNTGSDCRNDKTRFPNFKRDSRPLKKG